MLSLKENDFVRYIHSNTSKPLKINNINCGRYYFEGTNMSCLEYEIRPWTPEPGDWCWNSIFGLVKVLCETKTKGHFICWNPWRKEEQTLRINEPFIGELPQFNAISDEKTITRVEIITEKGRAFVDTKSTYTLSFQDNDQTLKLFKKEPI